MTTPRTEIQPQLWVVDGPAAVAFYERALGASVEHMVSGPGAQDVVAQLAIGAARFWVSNASEAMGRLDPSAIGGATARFLLVVEEPEAVMASAVAEGARETSPVGDEHGWRLGRFVDPFGHEWEIGRPLGTWPPAEV
jgi:PhnB protein